MLVAGGSPSPELLRARASNHIICSLRPPPATRRSSVPLSKTPIRHKRSPAPPRPPPPPPPPVPPRYPTDLLLESCHRNHVLHDLLSDLSKHASDPLHVLRLHGDWTADQFWLVVAFLREQALVDRIRKVFDAWCEKEPSRINVGNCSKMIRLLCDEGAMGDANSVLEDMERHSLSVSLPVYNWVVAGFASQGNFDGALCMIKKMRRTGRVPVNKTYEAVLRAYGDRRMYDEMNKCAKKMALDGCCLNEATYNLMVVEYARGLLLERMEGLCYTMLVKKMKLHPSTLVEMLEAYAEIGTVVKMERVLRRALTFNAFLKESVIRKVASVYIRQYRFVRLEEFGVDIGSHTGRTPLVWCIILLASACILSLNGMTSVFREMERAGVEMSITFVNIVALAYLKMRDFTHLDGLLCRIRERNIKPDLVTIGILFDGCEVGYDCTKALKTWRRSRFLDENAVINTDPLVLLAFGKGSFLKSCEKLYMELNDKEKEKTVWRYRDLMNLVFRNNGRVQEVDSP